MVDRSPEQGGTGARPPRLVGAHWLEQPETQAVIRAIAAGGEEARAVGGAVRNALLGRAVKDIDLATPALPETVMRLAERAGLKAIPTGIEHGTVTVVVHHVPFEVTTLRRDIETFGRHARVTFTSDWAEDAGRRDFTINALYAAGDGTIHDPLGGYDDIVHRRVRFIGHAEDRIREDYLRILRFFRFTAEYAQGHPDRAGLEASARLSEGLTQLSRERVRAELLRLLAAPGALPAVASMEQSGILARVLPTTTDVGTLSRLVEIEAILGRPADSILRLGALAARLPGDALKLRDGLRLSASEYERLARMSMRDSGFDPATPVQQAKAFIYRHGPDAYRDGALLAWARSSATTDDAHWSSRASLAERWRPPSLPIRGADVVALGIPQGPDVGRVMASFEEWWMGTDFTTDQSLISDALARCAVVTKQ
jgi:poly(A) polymerase